MVALMRGLFLLFVAIERVPVKIARFAVCARHSLVRGLPRSVHRHLVMQFFKICCEIAELLASCDNGLPMLFVVPGFPVSRPPERP
jgi:hypothetical protein